MIESLYAAGRDATLTVMDPRNAARDDRLPRGSWATLLLPIAADDTIDYALLRDELEHFVAAGVSGVYSNGSAGEFHTQTEDEFDRIHALLAEVCGEHFKRRVARRPSWPKQSGKYNR